MVVSTQSRPEALVRPNQLEYSDLQLKAGDISYKRVRGEFRRSVYRKQGSDPQVHEWYSMGQGGQGRVSKSLYHYGKRWILHVEIEPNPPGKKGELYYEAYMLGWNNQDRYGY